MSAYLADAGVNVVERRSAWDTLSNMNSAYTELAIDAGLAVGGAVPVYGWAADAVALGRSWSSGTWGDVMFDLAGFVPLFGDGAKGARIAARLDEVRRTLDVANTAMGRMFGATKEAARKYWDDMVAARRADYEAAVRRCGTDQACKDAAARLKGPQYENTPSSNTGTWSGERGDSTFTPNNGGAPITYQNGFPQFGGHSAADVDIPMTGNRTTDRMLAEREMLRNNPDWEMPANHVWHHNENGVTMQLVPQSIHNVAMGGVSHTGGASLYTGAQRDGF